MGIVSEIVPVFARKPIFGYRAVVLGDGRDRGLLRRSPGASTCSSVGLGTGFNAVFMVTALALAVPIAVKVFNWLATLRDGNISFDTPMLWALGFIAVVHGRRAVGALPRRLPGQLAAVRLAVRRRAPALHALRRLAVRRSSAGLTYWWPKLFGRMLDERLGKLHFWLVFVGFNVTFLPQHPARVDGDAAARLHVRFGRPLGGLQHGLDDRLVRDRRWACWSSSRT